VGIARIRADLEDTSDDLTPVPEKLVLSFQPGPQTKYCETGADICILGGAAGGGKSYALLLDALRNVYLSGDYHGVIFRRTTPSITHPGSLWDTSMKLYGPITGAEPFISSPRHWKWTNPGGLVNSIGQVWNSGAKVQFSHLEHENTVLDWHGSQIPFIGFDELTEFTAYQFWYMLSRNRSTCGVKPYIRATCNANSDSWVAELISWWIDQDTGFPIPERDGVLRWFIRVGDELKWADKPDDLNPERLGLPRFTEDGKENQFLIKSLTFISAKIYDNKILMRENPEYMGNLLSLPKVERERLLGGNWKIKPAAGLHFNRIWCEIISRDQIPSNLDWKRGWDLAATKKTALNDPDFTTATLIGKDPTGEDPYTYVKHHMYGQWSSGEVEKRMRNIASQDGPDVEQALPQDPGAAGKSDKAHKAILLDGYIHSATTEKGDKVKRFGPFSSAAEAGLVKVVRDYDIVDGQKVYWAGEPWNERWFQQLEGFPELTHDDDVDSTARAFNAFATGTDGMLNWAKQEAKKVRAQQAGRDAFIESNRPDAKVTKENGVCFKSTIVGVNILYGMKGEPIFCDENGYFYVNEKHAEVLRKNPKSGFKEIKLNE